MKTRNNVQKLALKVTAVVASIVLIGLNVNAQALFAEFMSNDKHVKISFPYVPSSGFSTDTRTDSYFSSEYFVVETESELVIEEWMLYEPSSNWMLAYSISEIEESLDVEDWMVSEKYFNDQVFEINEMLEDEIESELDLESWMIDDNIWNLQ